MSTTKMSSRGQLIPEAIRDQLGLEPGARFVVVGQDDVVMLKLIKPPSMTEYQTLKQAHNSRPVRPLASPPTWPRP